MAWRGTCAARYPIKLYNNPRPPFSDGYCVGSDLPGGIRQTHICTDWLSELACRFSDTGTGMEDLPVLRLWPLLWSRSGEKAQYRFEVLQFGNPRGDQRLRTAEPERAPDKMHSRPSNMVTRSEELKRKRFPKAENPKSTKPALPSNCLSLPMSSIVN